MVEENFRTRLRNEKEISAITNALKGSSFVENIVKGSRTAIFPPDLPNRKTRL